MPSVYGLDVTDASRWEETVLKPALQILDHIIKVTNQSHSYRTLGVCLGRAS